MNKTVYGMAIVAFVLITVAYLQGGAALVISGFINAGGRLVSVSVIIVVAFTVAGFASILIPKDLVSKWLGGEAGWKGPLFGTLLGALVPGGPFFFYPLMATLIGSGANIGTMISFVAAKTLWYVGRIPIEIAFAGLEITVVRFLVTFFIPIVAGMAVDKFLPGYADKIRADIQQLQLKNRVKTEGGNNG